VGNVVHHDAEAFDGADAEEAQIGRLGKDNFVGRFISFGPKNRVADLALDDLLGRGLKSPFPAGRDAGIRPTLRLPE
jgi:hypothetical protein